jgi:hypothetical protein
VDGANDLIVDFDRSGEVWVGRFRGVGEVRVGPDGATEVRCDSDDPTAEASLRHGWADLLSFARRGVQLLSGTALARPGGRAVLLTGDPIATSEVARALAGSDWAVVSDRPTPVTFAEDAIVAEPRPGPLLIRPAEGAATTAVPDDTGAVESIGDDPDGPRVATGGTTTTPLRPDSDVAALDGAGTAGTAVIGALVEVHVRHLGEDDDLELRGHDRFEHASRLHLAGALRPHRPSDGPVLPPNPPDADDEVGADATLIGEHLRLAALPALRVRFDRGDGSGAAQRLLAWLDRVWVEP